MASLDRHRIGRFTAGGRFTAMLDLNPGDGTYEPLRDAFKVTPPVETAISAKNSRRYGGSSRVAEVHDNGQIDNEFYIRGSSADNTLTKLDALLALTEDSRTDLFYEWRPANASRSVYFDIRGAAWEPTYRWIEFQSLFALQVKLTLNVAPLAVGDPLDIFDDFSTDTLTAGDYTFDAGSGTIAATGGTLVSSTTAVKQLAHTARGYTYSDQQSTLRVNVGASVGPFAVAIGKRIDASNYLVAQIDGTSGLLRILKSVAGTQVVLGSIARTLTASTSYWLRFRQESTTITAEAWTTDPQLGGTPATTVTYALAGGEITTFGPSAPGAPMIRFNPGSAAADWTIDDFRVEPYTYPARAFPAAIDILSVPGTAPAKFDLTYTATTGVPAWALFAFGPTPATGANGVAPFNVIEAETGTSLTNLASTANAAARGGNSLNSAAAITAMSASWAVDPSLLTSDEFQNTIDVEVWAVLETASALTSLTAVTSYTSAGGQTTYTREWQNSGKQLVLPSTGSAVRPTRLGSLTLPVSAVGGSLTVALTSGSATAAGSIKLDYLVLVPARSRALSPTSKNAAAGYPTFISALNRIKKINFNLQGFQAASYAALPGSSDSGLGGQLLEMPPGNVRILPFLQGAVPDDPTSNTAATLSTYSGALHLAIQPRYFLARSS